MPTQYSRPSRLLRTASLVSLTLALPAIAASQTITGTVTDSTGTAPFEGASVTVEELGRTVDTNRYGEYRIYNLPAGTYNLTVDYLGADSVSQLVTVPAEGTTVNFTLGSDVRYIDNVIVVGTKAAQAGAINQQRSADSIISVIDSDGLGNFPDTTVADSLSRVAGLSIETDQGEGRYVSIRGINTDLISSSINGVRTPSPEDRRGVLLDGVPSDLLDGITVQKSLTPDVDADSLGGVIDLKTISAFDRNGQFIRAKAEGRYNEIAEEISPKGTLTYSNVFGDVLGVALSANYQDLRIETHNNETDEWSFEEDAGGFILSDGAEQRWYGLNRERIGFVGNFDYRPNTNDAFYLRTLFNNYEDDEVRNVLQWRDLADDAMRVGNTQVLPLNETGAEIRQRREVRKIQTISAGGEHNRDVWNFDYEVAYAYAQENDSDNHDATFRFEDIQDSFPGDVTFDFANPQTPLVSGSPVIEAIYDPSNYELDAFEEEFTDNEDTEYSAQVNVERASLLGDMPVTWKAGAKYRDREKVRDANINIWEGDLNLSGFVDETFIEDWRLPNRMVFWPDPDLTAALRGNAQGNLELDEEATVFEGLAEDFTVEEKILAGYAMGTFGFDKLTAVAGVRVEQSDTRLTGFSLTEGDDAADAALLEFSNDYTDILPSLNLKYEFNDKLLARAAYYAAVVRPGFGEFAPFVRVNDDRNEVEMGNPNLEPYTADNFDFSLEFYPSEVSVFSVGVFHKKIKNAIYGVNFEREEIGEDENGDPIFESFTDFAAGIPVDLSYLPSNLTDDIFDGDEEDIVEVATFINVDDTDLFGVEFNVVQDLALLSDNLDGFLFSANLTLTDSEAMTADGREVPFLKQSDTVWNVALGYDKGPLDLRVSANYRGDYLDELVDEDLDRYTNDRLLIEASAKYDVNDNIQVYLEGKNLTDEPEFYYFGDESRLSQYDEFGRTFIVGARLTY